ncbi:hypothetical protein AMTRI_Chr02g217310 [Amborella trichopoda]|uniref:Late embryogenesis abundant protein LEA-2 subgroup domain-containing protein n=1 Tax=Amborella trichopoda TaxID=13333 RepID=W1NEE3_AMBTC|nr:uncharacterized protein LOC18421481 [Amborella trichopoda]ERM93766.1 hypothetical protein AMTR_s00004p00269390 [Amborella trichopoda]|eukprot:XP_006826529.1 uncharacterized protein LOC18421481 [Amborella trichopoda]
MASKRPLKICCGVTFLLILLLGITLVILYFTLLKPKQPKVEARAVTLENIEFGLFPVVNLNVTLGLVLLIRNPNVASFKFSNSTAFAYYRGVEVAQSPVPEGRIAARGSHMVSTRVVIVADKLVTNPNFFGDILKGSLFFTSISEVSGKVGLFGIVKFRAMSSTSCEITVVLPGGPVNSTCNSAVKF